MHLDANKIKQLDGSLLLVLRELLRQRRASLAARQLGLSQSAISHALARLRDLFGDPLFIRKPHGLEPTRHALELEPRIESLLLGMHEAMSATREFVAAESTRGFRIGAPDHVSTLLAPPLLECLGESAPRARVVFSQRLGADAQQALLRDELDLALGIFSPGDERMHMEPLYEDRYCLVARRGHPRLQAKLTPALYARLDQVRVSVSADFSVPDFLQRGRRVTSGRVVAAVPRFMIALAVVSHSDAVSIAPTRLARRYARNFNLRVHPLPFDPGPLAVMLTRRRNEDAGIDFLAQQLRAAVAKTA